MLLSHRDILSLWLFLYLKYNHNMTNKFKTTLIATFTCLLTACYSNTEKQNVGVATHNQSLSNNIPTKRINTTDCKDSDDWYLDGYRVGKSFTQQKNEMFNQRVNYCQFSIKQLPSHFKSNWERGFNIGINDNKQPSKRQAKKKKA
ncbi:hypothetical protein HT665_02195 [Ursidibacter maritimus]|uniref:Lipoprotein n=2 Tax=Ursidibacter maritimus TaxID=1331689 RepID=A0ABS6S726_9PAST|nr:hypothetical protein [Ursidibacter maritimus]KAE9539098.1 hypothetical protein A1D26_03450 [Ursidibacter maritimus]MBV6531105.1 hypothetical protein [Ursidibacter maritimus]MBV6537137.1 hypothetical protein [Ursidibacter maritimus]MBV6538385.1 hypothetical protein [Ursidibacter maritimus]